MKECPVLQASKHQEPSARLIRVPKVIKVRIGYGPRLTKSGKAYRKNKAGTVRMFPIIEARPGVKLVRVRPEGVPSYRVPPMFIGEHAPLTPRPYKLAGVSTPVPEVWTKADAQEAEEAERFRIERARARAHANLPIEEQRAIEAKRALTNAKAAITRAATLAKAEADRAAYLAANERRVISIAGGKRRNTR